MAGTRLRWGALAWVLTLQFFVVEAIVQARLGRSYSRADEVISVLGAAGSPAATAMNASFVVQAVLVLGGALLLRPALPGTSGRLGAVLFAVAAAGVLLVGVFPLDAGTTLHTLGAGLYLVGGGLGLIALATTLRPRSEALGTTLAALGVIGTAMTVFYVADITDWFGTGGTERVAAYVLPVGLAIAGGALLRGPVSAVGRRDPEGVPSRRALRERRRAERAAQAAERDAALEAATRQLEQRHPAPPAPRLGEAGTAAGDASRGDGDGDDGDVEDHWAPRGRRDR
ncbi:DUF998 domain-containing protein [Geodermatophilus sp. YIM 151500]|uniref:DUF998 domain-containing protein n=1 Tax=Geodermatophilus sp. YIM 151500 TaxID=2984531 RepID=UPI0021E4E2BC|nr:DUF998 domain-containing protein [Geodermatophilus sp. YIM 151500]MCV2491502.1 DUF998 domain-containing protein [Geodermatophilus sp. YIM 151500]